MNKFQSCLFAVCIILMFGCQKKEEAKMILPEKSLKDYTWDELAKVKLEEANDVTLDSVGIFKMPIDPLTHNPIIYLNYFEDGKDQFLVHYSEATNSLDILDMNSKRVKKVIRYDDEGIFAVHRKSRPYVKSMDSIFIWSWNPSMMLMVDRSGKQQDVFIYPDSLEKVMINMVSQYFTVGNKMVIAYKPVRLDFQLRDTSTYVVYDLKSRKISKSKVGRPLSVSNFPMYGAHPVPRFCKGQNNSIVNYFGAGQLIMQSTLDSDSIKYFILRSKYLPNTYPPPEHVDGYVKEQKYVNGSYHLMTYDPYNKYYYMMCLLGAPNKENGELPDPDYLDISIIITDTLFMKRGEVLLRKNKYHRTMFVTRNGLFVSNANPNNKDRKEGELSYTIFKPRLSR